MSIFKRDKNTKQLSIEIGGFSVVWWQNWAEIFRRQNWYNFTFLRIEAEYAPYKDMVEVSVGLIGFNVCFSYYNPEYIKRIEERFKKSKPKETPDA